MVPVPDPTLLTTEQLIRSMAALREILEARFDGTDKVIKKIVVAHEAGAVALYRLFVAS